MKNRNSPFQYIEIDEMHTIGLSTGLTRSQRENFALISRLWKRFNAEIHKIKNRPPSRGDWQKFGITYAREHEYHYLAAIPYMDAMLAPENMMRKDIARGRYARFTHLGSMSDLKSTIHAIYRKILPENNLIPESREKAGLIHFERYDNRFHWSRPDSVIEIYTPMETGSKWRSE